MIPRPGPVICLAISDTMRVEYPGISSRHIPVPFEELRVCWPLPNNLGSHIFIDIIIGEDAWE